MLICWTTLRDSTETSSVLSSRRENVSNTASYTAIVTLYQIIVALDQIMEHLRLLRYNCLLKLIFLTEADNLTT